MGFVASWSQGHFGAPVGWRSTLFRAYCKVATTASRRKAGQPCRGGVFLPGPNSVRERRTGATISWIGEDSFMRTCLACCLHDASFAYLEASHDFPFSQNTIHCWAVDDDGDRMRRRSHPAALCGWILGFVWTLRQWWRGRRFSGGISDKPASTNWRSGQLGWHLERRRNSVGRWCRSRATSKRRLLQCPLLSERRHHGVNMGDNMSGRCVLLRIYRLRLQPSSVRAWFCWQRWIGLCPPQRQ